MKRRACIVVSSEMTVLAFLRRQIAAMQKQYAVTVVLNAPSPELARQLGDVSIRHMPIRRHVSPVGDLLCLIALVRMLRAGGYDLVHSMTPKAGLLGMLAAWIAGVPVRVHTFTGQVWATRAGLPRAALRALDRVIARAATFTLADSFSQRAFLASQGVAPLSKIAVIGQGSVSGVDPARFRPDAGIRRSVRASLNIPDADTVLLFVGRLQRDKGVLDLARAFAAIASRRPDVHLVAVGPDEQRLTGEMRGLCGPSADRLHFCGYTRSPELHMAAADVLCLPSYREGFGSVIIEAAAAGIPAVASRIYGVVDAVVEGSTGLLHETGDVAGLAAQLEHMLADRVLRRTLGEAARARAIRDFAPAELTAGVMSLYAQLLQPVPARTGRRPRGFYPRYGKRAFDVVGAASGLVVLLPVMVVLALLIRLCLGAPVLFRQQRPGRYAVLFSLLKFRSMADRRGPDGRPLPDARRLMPLGRFLRATSLDELPELWNVLKGDMSLVGPRPLLVQYLALYSPRQARRHDVRPGITGLAQVSGRNALSWPERFELDVDYVERCSFALDLSILVRTVLVVLTRRGVAQPGRATVDYFEGNVAGHG